MVTELPLLEIEPAELRAWLEQLPPQQRWLREPHRAWAAVCPVASYFRAQPSCTSVYVRTSDVLINWEEYRLPDWLRDLVWTIDAKTGAQGSIMRDKVLEILAQKGL